MSFVYKNPLSSINISTPDSVLRDKTFGTNFSVLQIGGYMEVYTLQDLIYTVPSGSTGVIEFTGNTIPIQYSKRTLAFLPDILTLNSDNISSGRRRLGMLVYVHETQKTYQYTIPNFESLWNSASGSTTEGTYGTTVSTTTAGGTAFIDAWLDSSIEGVSGVTRDNARWKIFYGTDITVTGGTYNNATGVVTFSNTTGGTFTVTGFTTGSTTTSISGITYGGDYDLDLANTDGSSDTVTLPFISGSSYSAGTLTLSYAGGLETDLIVTGFVSSDISVTGGTFAANTLTLTKSDDSTVVITGFTSEDTYLTGATYSPTTLTLGMSDGTTFQVTGFSASITGGTYSDGEITLDKDDDSSVTVTGLDILTHFDYVEASGVTNNTVVDVTSLSLYQSVAYDYVINDGTNYRSGEVHAVWDGTQVQFNDVSTIDIGSTAAFEWTFDISGGNARLIASVSSGSWDVRLGKNQL